MKDSKKVITIMTTILTLQNLAMTQTGPFFPIIASSKGVSERLIGVIIGANPMFYIIASFTMVKKLK